MVRSVDSWDRATLDASGDGYTVLRAVRAGDLIVDWVIVDANALVRERWAWVVGDIVGVLQSRLNGAADNSAFTEVYARALATRAVQTLELQLELPAAKGGWRRIVVTPLDDETVSVVTRDISRERHLEAALEDERKRPQARTSLASVAATDTAAEARFAGRATAVMFLCWGVVALLNSLVSELDHVNVAAVRLCGVGSILFGFVVLLMPWERHFRFVANSIVVLTLPALVIAEHFLHYTRSEAAVGMYPVFFLLLIAWTGVTRPRGAATITAIICAPVLYYLFATGGKAAVGWQCLVVTLPVAAGLGEVLAWNSHRARTLTNIETQRRLHDPLTGLANRTLLSIQLDKALARARRGGGAVAVFFIDLDHFKHINDTRGHAAGDEVLVDIGNRLRLNARESDTVARIGGDEFVLLYEDLRSIRDATELAQRILDCGATSADSSAHVDQQTLSIGIAFTATGSETGEALLQNADLALYRAKQEGRARFEVFGDHLRHQVAVRRELETALRQGIGRNELRVHFQPIISAGTGTIQSFEALVRWERPGYGLVPPLDFIPVAEETGLIVELGAWVLNQSCQQAASWATRWPERRIGVSVNLSAHQLIHGDVIALTRHALRTSGLDPRLLTLELTESTLIDNPNTTRPLLLALRDLGVNLAIDDFGTGYSSLTYLRQFPVNVLKIDQSFIRAIGTEREDTAIVAAVINLARNLNLDVVAEGVETLEQLAVLVQLNCEHLQGYLFARPAPADQIPQLVEAHATWSLIPTGTS